MLAKGVQLLRDAVRYHRFPRAYSAFRGVYPSLSDALDAVPRGKRIGYDLPALAEEYVATLRDGAESYDYPVMFHLDRIRDDVQTVFDFGGNVGTHFYVFDSY